MVFAKRYEEREGDVQVGIAASAEKMVGSVSTYQMKVRDPCAPRLRHSHDEMRAVRKKFQKADTVIGGDVHLFLCPWCTRFSSKNGSPSSAAWGILSNKVNLR